MLSSSGGPAASGRPPLLLVHGICHGAWCWQPHYAPYFTSLGYDVHSLSLRGHAGSPDRAALHGYGLADYADDVTAVAGALDRPPVLVGHSMGGGIVQLVLRRHTAIPAVAAVLLAPMTPGGLTMLETLALARSPLGLLALRRLLAGDPLSAAQANRLPFFGGRLAPANAALAAGKLQPESRRAIRDLRSFAPAAGPAAVPVLVVGSSRDRLFGTAALRRTSRHYDAELVVLDTGCHDLMLDPGWESSAAAIAGWIARTT